ncbi:Iron-sulfur assembly protein 1 [Nakaseomyces bracarensis]|uniref:Iron-sulfur assembly protein 1 n=1 Tax=Nakaseomyces bracarensis TaxID=273131 RepID=A0ABR4NTL3_9SACH
MIARQTIARQIRWSSTSLRTSTAPNFKFMFKDKNPKWSSYKLATPQPIQKELGQKKKRRIRPSRALITLTPSAVAHLRSLTDQPAPKLIRISAKHRGCAGLSYDLSYIDSPGKFDEVVEQDGVKVVIDSKALFSIVGSEMDWVETTLFSKFVFKNPNSKGTCGCGESFMI